MLLTKLADHVMILGARHITKPRLIRRAIGLLGTLAMAMLLSLVVPAMSAGADDQVKQPLWQTNLETCEKAFLDGNSEAGKKLYLEALSSTSDDTARATIINQLGVIQMQQRQFLDAEKTFHQALELRNKSLGETNMLTLQTLSNLALATYKFGDEQGAEKLYKQCIEQKRKAGPATASLATTLTNLAHLYSDERRCAESQKLYLEALEIDTKNFGANHKEVANDLFNVGALLHRCNQFSDALTYFEKAKDVYTACGDKLGSAKTLHYMSLCHGALKNFDKAAETSMQAVSLHEEVKGKGHPDTLVHLLTAADALNAAGKPQQAETLYKQALTGAQAAAEPSNAKLAECNLELAQFYKKQGRKDEAEHYFKKALTHYEGLTKKEKRSLYELPLAYSQLLHDLKRDDEGDHLAHKYLNVYAPGP